MGLLDIQEPGEIDAEVVQWSAADGEGDFVPVAGAGDDVLILVTNGAPSERVVTVSPADRHAGMPDAAHYAEDIVRELRFDDTAVLGPFPVGYIDRDGRVRVTYDLADGVSVAAIAVRGTW